MIYLHLFHGRKPGEVLEDAGSDGPVLELEALHITYSRHVRARGKGWEDFEDLSVVDDCLYYNGVLYGDWSIFSEPLLREDGFTAEPIDQSLISPPEGIRLSVELGYFTHELKTGYGLELNDVGGEEEVSRQLQSGKESASELLGHIVRKHDLKRIDTTKLYFE